MKVYKIVFDIQCGLLDVIVVAPTKESAKQEAFSLAHQLLFGEPKLLIDYELSELSTTCTFTKVVTYSHYEE